jgi:hypothetical protein
MSQAITLNAVFEDGYVKVTLQDTTVMGLKDTMPHVFPYGYISVPDNDMVAEISPNSEMQQPVLGCIPHITKNMNIAQGESAIYSHTWRYFMRNNGIQLQQIETNKTAHAMMGEDTNKVIADLLKEVKSLSDKLNTFMSETFNLHTHAITDPSKSITVTPVPIATPFIPSPDIATDTQYIDANKNLATDDYTPREVHDGTVDTK